MDSPGTLRLSVLDQSPIAEGSTGAQALKQHRSTSPAWPTSWAITATGWPSTTAGRCWPGRAPRRSIGPIAAATGRIRVGSGGVMLPHYSPLKVAETFSLLAGLFPGRIDLGIGRAAGTDPLTTLALQRDRRQAAPDDFAAQLAELLAYLEARLPPEHPFARLADTLPGAPERPQAWLLGSSHQSALWAAELGLPYAFADFINSEGAEIAALYRERFAAIWQGERRPRTAVAAWVICADGDEEAQRIAASGRMAFRMLRQGRLIPVPPPERAERFLASAGPSQPGAGRGRRTVVGAPDTVREQLLEVVGSYGAEEAIAVNITYSHEDRRRSYELLAAAFALEGGPDASTGAATGVGGAGG